MQEITNKIILSGCLLLMICINTMGAEEGPDDIDLEEDWTLKAVIETKYYSWKQIDGPAKGSQFVMPYTFVLNSENTNFGLRNAYIYSEHHTLYGEAELSTLSDTNLSFKHQRIFDNGKLQFLFDINVPTGTASLDAKDRLTIMDSNLVGHTRYGEGWNFTPSIIYTYAFTKEFYAGLGLGYTYRGEYKPNAEYGSPDFKPGDEYKLIFNAQYAKGKFLTTLGANYTIYDTSKLSDIDYFEQGNRVDLNLATYYQHNRRNLTSLYVYYINFEKNMIYSPVNGKIITEDQNSNSDYYLIGLSHRYKFTNKLDMTGSFDYLHKTANGFDAEKDQFLPKRDRYSVGIGTNYAFNKKCSVGLNTKYFWMQDAATPITNSKTNYHGFNVFLNLKMEF